MKISVDFFCGLGAFVQPCDVFGMRDHGWRFLIRPWLSLILVLSQLISVIALRLLRKVRLNISINMLSSPLLKG